MDVEKSDLENQDPRVIAALTAYLKARDSGRPLDRTEFLAAHPDLASELESFLAGQEIFEPLLDGLPFSPEGQDPVGQALAREPEQRQLGGYEILEEIARGGMGIVYRARQTALNREVALKMILAGRLAGGEDIRRFFREARAAASLDHPNIVPIYDVGEAGGWHYYSMKLLKGGDLSGALPRYLRDPAAAARVVEKVARAVQHAHERGILHRDLKPANILLDENGEPHVADFGLAKQMDERTTLTRSGLILGTLVYSAPEQAAGQGGRASPASDVYSLGAILYKLLSGRPPFQAKSPTETLKQVLSDDPAPPSRWQASVPRDLETICLKCLEKEPRRRYPSALELAEDLRRYLAGEPIRARPPGALERGVKWARRRPELAALAAVSILAALAFATFGPGYFKSLEKSSTLERQRKLDAEAEMRLETHRRYATRIRLAYESWEQGKCDITREILSELVFQGGEEDRRGFEWYHLWHLAHADRFTRPLVQKNDGSRPRVAFSPDGRTLAVAERGGSLFLWDPAAGNRIAWSAERQDWILAFSPDGRFLATGGGLVKNLAILDAGTAAVRWDLSASPLEIASVAFSPDGNLVATGCQVDKSLTLREAATGRVMSRWIAQSDNFHPGALAFSPDGETLASGSDDNTIKLWEVKTGKELFSWKCRAKVYEHGIQFSADGKLVAARTDDRSVMLCTVATGVETKTFDGEQGILRSFIAFSPDGRWFAMNATDVLIRLWNLAEQKEKFLSLPAPLTARLAFSADGKILATAIEDNSVRLWEAETGNEIRSLKGHNGIILDLDFSPDGKTLATASLDQTVKIWDFNAPPEPSVLRGHPTGVESFAWPDGSRLLVSGDWKFNTKLSRLKKTLGGTAIEEIEASQIGEAGSVTAGAITRDGQRSAAARRDGMIQVWRCSWGEGGGSREEEAAFKGPRGVIRSLMFSPDGTLLAAAGSEKQVMVWALAPASSPERWVEKAAFSAPGDRITHLAFSPDRRLLAMVQNRLGEVWLRDLERLEYAPVLKGHTDWVDTLIFSDDSRILVTGSLDRKIKLWSILTAPAGGGLPASFHAGELRTLQGHNHTIAFVTFSPDGKRLLSFSDDKLIKIWDAFSWEPLAALKVPWVCTFTLALSPDGQFLAAGCETSTEAGEVFIFRAATEAEVQARRENEIR